MDAKLRNVEYLLLAVMSELSTVRCIVCLVFGCRYTGVECRRRADVEVLWPMDRAVDGGEGQPGLELGPGGSYGVHSWIEGEAATEDEFLGLRHKTKEADGS